MARFLFHTAAGMREYETDAHHCLQLGESLSIESLDNELIWTLIWVLEGQRPHFVFATPTQYAFGFQLKCFSIDELTSQTYADADADAFKIQVVSLHE